MQRKLTRQGNRMSKTAFILTGMLFLALVAAAANAQEIYRVVDKDGNVTYTDTKPDDNARPIDLPEVNVLEGDSEEEIAEAIEQAEAENQHHSMGFRITQPADGSTVDPGSDALTVVMDIGIDVPPTAQIVLVLDDEALPPIHDLEAEIAPPAPGSHVLFARLETPSGKVLGKTEPVRFTLREGGRG